jgi:hypothetical protein
MLPVFAPVLVRFSGPVIHKGLRLQQFIRAPLNNKEHYATIASPRSSHVPKSEMLIRAREKPQGCH